MMTKFSAALTTAAATCVTFFFCGRPTYADEPQPEVLTEASKSVGQVIARGCKGPDRTRTGSGFIWGSTTQVVTALHVVSNCEHVAVYFRETREIPAEIVRVLVGADLALLSIPPRVSAKPLVASSSPPATNDTLQAIGYYFGVKTLDNRPVHVTMGSPVLDDMVTEAVRRALKDTGSPSLNTQILRLDGNLLPGLSGAPLINTQGKVAGIGSGGLENGTVGVSWAIHYRYLADLAKAPLATTLPSFTHGPLFAAPIEGSTGRQIQCGDKTFAFIKTRLLSDLLETTDDAMGLSQIAATTGMQSNELRAIELDVFAEQDSGASVVLPRNTQLVKSNDQCQATITPGLTITVGSATVANQKDVQEKSVEFEQTFDPADFQWRPDFSFSYPVPLRRADGLVVRRKNIVGFVPANVFMPVADSFETLMTRGDTFVGVRVQNNAFNPLRYQACRMDPDLAGCTATNRAFASWVAAVIGVHMSTFPLL